jgi:hypothetical protein
MHEHLAGHATDESVDHIGIGDVRELIAFLREALNVFSKGLIGPLLAVVEVSGVNWAGVGTLKVADEDRMEIAQGPDATGLELLEPSSS